MPRQLIAIFALLSIMYGCGPQPASVGPKASEMVGRYTTKDKRAVKTTLDLHGDGTFTLANWPVTNGSGMWKIEQDTVTKMWKFSLDFTTPRKFYVSGYQVLGGPGNYSLGFFVGDPDEGAVVLEKQKP